MKFWIIFFFVITAEIPMYNYFNYFHFESIIRGYNLYEVILGKVI